jgi:hypothetical protein
VARRNEQPCPLCELLLNTLHQAESALDVHIGSGFFTSYASADLLSGLQQQLAGVYTLQESMQEMMYWILRVLAGISIVGLLAFLFYHD